MPYLSLHLTVPAYGASGNANILEALKLFLLYKDMVVSYGGEVYDEKHTLTLFQSFKV